VDVEQPSLEAFLRGDAIAPWACLEYPAHAATTHVGIVARAQGHNTTFASACAAGLDAIAFASDTIERGSADVVFAGATETPLSPFVLNVFRSVGVLSRWQGPVDEASRPYDALRSGLVLAEGAAIIVLEEERHARARGARIYARVLGTAAASEGEHLRKVDHTGSLSGRVMATALRTADIEPSSIDYICAHGNSLPDYDVAETRGIKRALGRHAWNVPISSIKSMCGQPLAAGSAMQVIVACLALRDSATPPTINHEHNDPECDLDYVPNVARRTRVRTVLIHAHSLGGSHIAAVVGTAS
jgi:3-oxoacyl-[acyl-carrier-protein] synthase II